MINMATKIAYYQTHRNPDLLDNETQYFIHESDSYSGVRRTINLLIRADGKVVDQGGEITQERGLNLGNQGDHLVTLIHFDTHELQWGKTDPEHGDDTEGLYLLEYEYEPVIHFYNPDKEYGDLNPISFKFEGGDFFVPQDLTKDFGKYQIIYSLREQVDKGVTPGNVGEESESLYREVFISNTFFGEVRETLFSSDNFSSWTGATELNEIQQTLYLKKPSVEIGIDGRTKEIFFLNSDLEWGNLQDNLMTDIRIDLDKWDEYLGGDWNSDSSFYIVFVPDEEGFNNGLKIQSVKLKYDAGLDINEDDTFYTYLPSVVTQNSNKWGAQLFAKPKQDELSYYNFTLPVIDYAYQTNINMDWMSDNGLVNIVEISYNTYEILNGGTFWKGIDKNGNEKYLGAPGETIKLRSWDFGTNTDILGEPEVAVMPQYFFAEPFEIQVKSNFLQQEDINPDEEQNIVDIPENALYDTYRFALTGRSSDENNPDASEFIITNEQVSYQLEQTGYQIQDLLNWVDSNRGWINQDELATKQELNILDNKYKEATTVELSENISLHYYEVGDNLSGQYIKSDKIAEIAGVTALKTKNGSNISWSGADGNWYFNIVYLDGSHKETEVNPQLFEYKFPWTGDDSYEIIEISDAAAFNTNVQYRRESVKNSIEALDDKLREVENDNNTLHEQVGELYGFTNYVEQTYATKDELNGKQDQLVSGTNIKTVNGQSILGEGNIAIEGGGSVPEGLEQRLEGIEEDIRILQQGLDGTLGVANSASQTANATANNLSGFTSYAEETYATKNNTYTKAEVDEKIANAGGGNDKYEYVRDDSLVYLDGDSETGICQTLYVKEDSTGYGKDFLGVFGGECDIWFFEGGILSIDGVDDFECQQVSSAVWSVNLPFVFSGASISPNDTNLNAYFAKQVEKSSGSIKLTDLR